MTQSLVRHETNAGNRTGAPVSLKVKRVIAYILPIALALGLLIPPLIPLQDYNEWIYQGYIAAQMLVQHMDGQFSFVHYPVPNSLVQALLTGLDVVLPPLVSGTLVICIYVVLAVTLAWKLAHKISAENCVDYFLVLMIFIYFNSTFWDGYINYQFGILLLSFYLLLDAEQRRAPSMVLVLLIVAFFTHAVIWGTFLLLFLLDAVRRRKVGNYFSAALSVCLFGWYVLSKPGRPAFPGFSPDGALHTIAYKIYTVAKLGPYHNFAFWAGGDWFTFPLKYWFGVALNLAMAAGFVLIVIEMLFRVKQRRQIELESIAGLILLLFFLAMPAVLADVVNPGERMLYPAMLLILFATPRSSAVGWMAWSSLVLVWCSISLAFTGTDTWRQSASANVNNQQFFHVLFVSRPNQFKADIDVLQGRNPTRPLNFETSFLVNRKGGR